MLYTYANQSGLRPDSEYEDRLHEFVWGTSSKDPTAQYEWDQQEVFEAAGCPHRTCIAIQSLPDVRGLVRSEMMTIMAMMLAQMEREFYGREEAFPVSGITGISGD
jgi:hypothetical protein